MACFLIPGAEAVITTIAQKVIEKKEEEKVRLEGTEAVTEGTGEKLSVKLKRLNALLWGGVVLLAFEHLWHGEIKPFFPFLTAAETKGAMTGVLHEMSTVGVGMAVLITLVWAVITLAVDIKLKKASGVETKTETAAE